MLIHFLNLYGPWPWVNFSSLFHRRVMTGVDFMRKSCEAPSQNRPLASCIEAISWPGSGFFINRPKVKQIVQVTCKPHCNWVCGAQCNFFAEICAERSQPDAVLWCIPIVKSLAGANLCLARGLINLNSNFPIIGRQAENDGKPWDCFSFQDSLISVSLRHIEREEPGSHRLSTLSRLSRL